MQMIKKPRNLNTMYSIANQWLKVNTKTKLSGYGMTFVITLDYQEEPKRGKKNEGNDKDKREEPKREEKENETNRKDLSEERPLCKQVSCKSKERDQKHR